jgi:hypothetical protein
MQSYIQIYSIKNISLTVQKIFEINQKSKKRILRLILLGCKSFVGGLNQTCISFKILFIKAHTSILLLLYIYFIEIENIRSFSFISSP